MSASHVVVVGAGPAGAAAALELARAGVRTTLIERGPYPGSKNVYGGVIYGRILDDLVPGWWDQAPIQRWVTRRSTMVLTPTQALTVDFRSDAWAAPPYNGATAFRGDFDRWLADVAVAEGATLLCSTTVTGLLRDEAGRITGVRTDRPDGDIHADLVIACDGVNSFLAKEAGLHRHDDASHYTLGVKEVIALPRDEIERRFNVRGRDGVDIEILGCTGDVPGGGFIYTNLDTIAIGVVLRLPELAAGTRRPEDHLDELKQHSAVAPLLAGGRVVDYAAHLIPEGGYDAMPDLAADGLLVAGDAAGMCLAAGIWLEGVNFAIGAGAAAGRIAANATASGRTDRTSLDRSYRAALEGSFVLADHKRLRNVPALVLGQRAQQQYPSVLCDLVEEVFTVRNPEPKQGILKLARSAMRAHGVRRSSAARDALAALRAFG